MSEDLPKRSGQILTLAGDIANGLKIFGEPVGLKHLTEHEFRAALDELTRAKNAVLSNARAAAAR